MAETPVIVAELLFLSTASGGRKKLPPKPWGVYMPHAVIEGMNDYLGVRFLHGPEPEFEVPGHYGLQLMYHPNVDYSGLTTGTNFTLREGGRVVAKGWVVNGFRP